MTQGYSFAQFALLYPGKSFDTVMDLWNRFTWETMHPATKAKLERRVKERVDVVKTAVVNR